MGPTLWSAHVDSGKNSSFTSSAYYGSLKTAEVKSVIFGGHNQIIGSCWTWSQLKPQVFSRHAPAKPLCIYVL